MGARPDYRALIVDVDGTLVDDTFVVAPPVRDALERVAARGLYVSLSTGKPVGSCIGYIEAMNLRGYHTFCAGAHVTDPLGAGDLYASRLDPAKIADIVVRCRATDITVELYSHDGYFMETENEYATIQQGFMLFGPTIVHDLLDVAAGNDVIKGHLILGTDREKREGKRIMEDLAGTFSFSLGHVSGRRDLDFHSILEKGVTKQAALERIGAATGIPLGAMVAVGDSGGDIGILKAAGVGVAMGDSPDEVKAAADCVVGTVQQHGLREAIERFFPQP